MSKFLGPIHYWLYEKIKKQEELTKLIADYSNKKGWIENSKEYFRDLAPLEIVIDETNIHGWLQEKIQNAEIRYGKLITSILKDAPERISEIEILAFNFGKENKINEELSVREVYKYFDDFFVNGMPCDHINQIVIDDENKLAWNLRDDIHKNYWPNGDTSIYYNLRKAIMDGIISDLEIKLIMDGPFNYILERDD